MTSGSRWEPDTNLAQVVLTSPRAPFKMTELADVDRAWLVAGLSDTVLGEAGLTADEIAERTDCCLRLVRSIRAADATLVAEYAQVQNRVLDDELRVERNQHGLTRRKLAESDARAARLQVQLDQILNQLQTKGKVETFRCGCEKTPYNTYEWVNAQGRRKRYCRRCRYRRKTESRVLTCAVVNS